MESTLSAFIFFGLGSEVAAACCFGFGFSVSTRCQKMRHGNFSLCPSSLVFALCRHSS
jgi:hypothetical protein